MRVEHPLKPAMARSVDQLQKRLAQLRMQYLAALGQAKEAEQAIQSVRQALSQQLGYYVQTENLPTPVEPYELSEDGKALVGDVAEKPAGLAALNQSAAIEDASSQRVNGQIQEGHPHA